MDFSSPPRANLNEKNYKSHTHTRSHSSQLLQALQLHKVVLQHCFQTLLVDGQRNMVTKRIPSKRLTLWSVYGASCCKNAFSSNR